MFSAIIAWLASLIINTISDTGYLGVFILMLLESACIPVPSEIIMPFSGFLVWQGKFNLWTVVFWGAFGSLIGSIIAYYIGFYGGRPLIEKYGKYVLISRRDLDRAHNWIEKHGQGAIFFSRLLPAVRTFISLPAGIVKMDFGKFCVYTFFGSLIWSYFLTYAGVIMGENWNGIRVYFEKFDIVIVIAAIFGIIWWVVKHFKK